MSDITFSDAVEFAAVAFATKPLSTLAGLAISVYFLGRLLQQSNQRVSIVPHSNERVLIIGGSSGIGHSVALQYAARGAKVCVTGRRSAEIEKVVVECRAANETGGKDASLGIVADFTSPSDMVRVRSQLEKAWGGLDTIIVSAGVSALRPLLDIAGVSSTHPQTSAEDIQRTVDVATKAQHGNYIGPLVSAVAFIPFLKATSKAPAILLVSSMAAVIPAPTRSVYGSTKSASLILYQALAIENPAIKFSMLLPFTVKGDFRASAVDGGEVREADPSKTGLKRVDVARRCIQAVDGQEKVVFMPGLKGRASHFLYWIVPGLVERMASKKYNFSA